MTNRLKAYVRRTILESARDYAHPLNRRTKASTQSAFNDAVRGTDTGWWNDLIYTGPMLDMAHRYRTDIAATIRAYMDETGEGYGSPIGNDPEEKLSLGMLIDATSKRYTMADYTGDNDAIGHMASAKLFGLRFAVEWLTHEVAGELGVEL